MDLWVQSQRPYLHFLGGRKVGERGLTVPLSWCVGCLWVISCLLSLWCSSLKISLSSSCFLLKSDAPFASGSLVLTLPAPSPSSPHRNHLSPDQQFFPNWSQHHLPPLESGPQEGIFFCCCSAKWAQTSKRPPRRVLAPKVLLWSHDYFIFCNKQGLCSLVSLDWNISRSVLLLAANMWTPLAMDFIISWLCQFI